MQPRSHIARAVALLCTALIFAAPGFVHAQGTSVKVSFASPQAEATPINVLVGQSRVINFDRPIGRFSVSNPEIAEAVLVAPDQVLVNGKGFGQVNFIAWEQKGEQFHIFDVFVRANLSLIDSQMRALFPKQDIRLSQANGSVVMSGSVSDERTSKQAEAVVQAAGFKTVNMMQTPVKPAVQVQLQVRVAEVSRNKLREVGSSYMYTNGTTSSYLNSGQGPSSLGSVSQTPFSTSMNTVLSPALNLFLGNGASGLAGMLRALHQVGAIRSLAEPNLIAMDGQQASFLAGGEFPIPVAQPSGEKVAVTIVFKEYGVRLNFKPTVIDEEHIRLELEPEVSTIDFSNGIKFDGFIIPALKTRRAKTGVELRDGQSFALAGLLDNNETQMLSKVPLIGDIPVLGQLFRSRSFQKNETELMFIVTAQIVKPINGDDLPRMRGVDGLKTGSPLGVEPQGEGITGASGYSTGTGALKSAAPAGVEKQPAPQPPAGTVVRTALPAETSQNSLENLPSSTLDKFHPRHEPAPVQVSYVEAPARRN